jgi:hypothetical protein
MEAALAANTDLLAIPIVLEAEADRSPGSGLKTVPADSGSDDGDVGAERGQEGNRLASEAAVRRSAGTRRRPDENAQPRRQDARLVARS